ncbi:MAG: methyltransferase domain-containing protein [Planctomycetota bacterium]
MDWQNRWIERTTPWDLKQVTPPLRHLLREGALQAVGLPTSALVAVPGCGRGHDLRAFVGSGYRAVGFDVVPEAVREARELLALNRVPELEFETGAARSGGDALSPGEAPESGAAVFCRDVLGLEPEWHGRFDLVFDYTCLCALKPHLRTTYLRSMRRALNGGGLFLHLAFPMRADRAGVDGPPYLLEQEMLQSLFTGEGFELVFEREAIASVPQRMGRERFFLWRSPGPIG